MLVQHLSSSIERSKTYGNTTPWFLSKFIFHQDKTQMVLYQIQYSYVYVLVSVNIPGLQMYVPLGRFIIPPLPHPRWKQYFRVRRKFTFQYPSMFLIQKNLMDVYVPLKCTIFVSKSICKI